MDQGRAKQLEIWKACGPAGRIAIASDLIAMTRSIRDSRLRRRYPEATDRELGWARVREALDLPSGITPP